MKTYLIARAKFKDRDFKKGIDSIIELEYMGSSEFEFGALPESLRLIRENMGNFIYFDIPIKNKIITVFLNSIKKPEIQEYLTELSENKMRLKEFSAFDEYIKDEGYFKDRVDFWWDIENHLMFWKKNAEFEKKFKLVIENKPLL